MWWNRNYTFRREVVITNAYFPGDAHPCTVDLPIPLMANKVADDFSDLHVVEVEEDDTMTSLPRGVVESNDFISVTFDVTKSRLSTSRFYLYYGILADRNLGDPIMGIATSFPHVFTYYYPLAGSVYPYVFKPYPVIETFDGGRVHFTRPGIDWVEGQSSTLGARATLRFRGDRIRIVSDTGPHWGVMQVKVANLPWRVVDLRAQTELPNTVVYDANFSNTDPVEVHVEVQKQGAPINIKSIEYRGIVFSEYLREEIEDSLSWSTSIGGG